MREAFVKLDVSIHASAREATGRLRKMGPPVYPVSIHASAREATIPVKRDAFKQWVSIHASAREATVTGVGLRG